MDVTLTYIYHSGFAVETARCLLVFDYYKAPVEGFMRRLLGVDKPVYVFVSHRHPDHFNPDIFSWAAGRQDIRYVLSNDVRRKVREVDGTMIFLKRGEAFADGCVLVRAFGSTDVGVSFAVETDGKRIFHAGDLNNWLWADESTEQEMRKAEGDFLVCLCDICKVYPAFDVAMFPVDPRMGTDFARGARQFVDKIKCRYFVPMHAWEMYALANTFAPVAEQAGCRFLSVTRAPQGFALTV